MLKINKKIIQLLPIWLLLCANLLAGSVDSVENRRYQSFVDKQNVELQKKLSEVLPEESGYIVVGPMNTHFLQEDFPGIYYGIPRVICPDLDALKKSIELINGNSKLQIQSSQINIENAANRPLRGFRGVILTVKFNSQENIVTIFTLQQLRLLLWTSQVLTVEDFSDRDGLLRKYAFKISDHLYQLDRGNLDAPEPKAVDFGLEEKYDLYAPAPDYVIQGYQNYKDYLKSHAEIVTSNVSEVLAFVPTQAGLERIKHDAPQIAYPNKESPLLQE